jgi:hypothetical protein
MRLALASTAALLLLVGLQSPASAASAQGLTGKPAYSATLVEKAGWRHRRHHRRWWRPRRHWHYYGWYPPVYGYYYYRPYRYWGWGPYHYRWHHRWHRRHW